MGKFKGEISAIESVASKSKQHPIILNFQNTPPNDMQLAEMDFNLAVDNQTGKKHVVLGSNTKVYSGAIGAESENTNFLSTYLAIRNKITNKIRLVEVEQCTLINAACTKDTGISLDNANKTYYMKIGGKMAARSYERNETGRSNVDLIANQMNKSMTNIGDKRIFNLEDMITNITNKKDEVESILPPKNPGCVKVKEVYTMEKIVNKDLLKHLGEVSHSILLTESVEKLFATPYLLDRVRLILKSETPSSDENIMKMSQLIYMDGLCRLLKVSKKVLKNVELSKVSEQVEDDLRNNFSQTGDSKMMNTAFTKTKSICYLLILAFLESEDHQLNMIVFTEGLDFTPEQAGTYAGYIGAKKLRANIYSLKTVAEKSKGIAKFPLKHKKRNL